MKDKIILHSRGEHNYLKKMSKPDGSESKTYVLKVENYFIRTGYVDNIHKFIDPSGGPMIIEGERLEEADAIVKSIDFVTGYGHIITFE